jgi:hypothetical protein
MTEPTAPTFADGILRALWELALDAWHEFDDDLDDSESHDFLERLVNRADAAIGVALLRGRLVEQSPGVWMRRSLAGDGR